MASMVRRVQASMGQAAKAMIEEDPALTEDINNLFARNDAIPLPSHHHAQNPHTAAVASIVKELHRLPGWKRVRKRPVGRFLLADASGRPRKKPGGGYIPISVAIAGDPDVDLLWTPPGANRPYAIMIEAKTGSAVLNPKQRDARDDLRAGGCVHIVASGGADAFEQVMAIVRR